MTSTQNGNALWFILIGVALLGFLTMVLSRGSSTVDQSGGFEQRQVKVSQMLRYAQSLQAAIEQMSLRGVSVNDISFENLATATNYTNANCTVSDCLVFDAGGAGLNYMPPPPAVSSATEWIFSGTNDVSGVGTTRPDLVMFLPDVRSAVCDHINRLLDTSYGGTETGIDFTAFAGTYTPTETIDLAAGQEAGCIQYNDGLNTNPLFYYVLIKR